MPMDERLYTAAQQGDLSVLEEYKNELTTQLTPYNNTVLHVAADSNSDFPSEDHAGKFLAIVGPDLLFNLNCNGDTCIHLAARKGGHVSFVTAVISYMNSLRQTEVEGGIEAAHELLRITNKKGDTALHEAARCGHEDMVELLVEKDKNFSHPPNKAGMSPLYLAVKKGSKACAGSILNNSSSHCYDGPDGTTALHVAATYSDAGFVEMILGKEQSLTKHVDELGWSPLHFAAYFGRRGTASMLLKHDKDMAYATIKDDNRTALHLAAIKGKVRVMEEILKICPDSLDAVTSHDQNVRQLAEASTIVIAFLDSRYGDSKPPGNDVGCECSYENTFIYHPYLEEMNSERNSKEVQSDLEENAANWKDRANTHLLVATLIATISFAAGFTIPGGYNDGGMAVLSKKAAFKAFVISDTCAMIFSTGAVLVYFIATFTVEKVILLMYAAILVMHSLLSIVIAFTSGLYVVLPSKSLAIAVCVISACIIVHCLWFLNVAFSAALEKKGLPELVNDKRLLFTAVLNEVIKRLKSPKT